MEEPACLKYRPLRVRTGRLISFSVSFASSMLNLFRQMSIGCLLNFFAHHIGKRPAVKLAFKGVRAG